MDTRSRRLPQLDAVRGIAILVVVFHNSRDAFPTLHLQAIFASGWMGVDLFFVLSGFLITGILLDTKDADGYYRNFYARRCLRIWPLYYALLAVMFVAVPLLRPAQGQIVFEKSSPWWAYPLFLQNVLLPLSTNAAGPLAVTWSLAIEEQFYVVWPIVVRGLSSSNLRRLAIAVVLASPVLRLGLSWTHVNVYTNVFCRLDGLMAGALLAVVVRQPHVDAGALSRRAWWLIALAGPLALATDGFGVRWLAYSFSVLASAAFVCLALVAPQRWLQRALANRALVFTGIISYGLYLLHKIPLDAVKGIRPSHPLVMFVGVLVASYAIAGTSWFVLERPFLRLKRYFNSGRPREGAAGLKPCATQGR